MMRTRSTPSMWSRHAGAPGRLHRGYPGGGAHSGALGPLSDAGHGLAPLLLIEQGPLVRVAASVTSSAKDPGGHARRGGSRDRGIVAVAAANQKDERRAATAQLQRDGERGADRWRTDHGSPAGNGWNRGGLDDEGWGVRSSGRRNGGKALEGRGRRRLQRGEWTAEAAWFVPGRGPEARRGIPPGVVRGLLRYPG